MDNETTSLLDLLKDIRQQVNTAFDILADEDFDEETSAMVWGVLDCTHDEISFVIQELDT